MNCRRLQNHLFEYLDGALSCRAQSAAKRHLDQCAACRQAVLDAQTAALSLSTRFRQDSESLVLNPNFQARIMAGVKKESARPSSVQFPSSFWRSFAWLETGAALFLVSIFLAAGLWQRHWRIAQSRGDDSGPAISLTISYCDPIYTFHTDGRFVVDSLDCQPRIVEESIRLSRTHKEETKSPL
jgi:hypothetical protein